jgi:hypothetical protein
VKFSVMRALQLPAKRKRRWEKRCIWCNRSCAVRHHARFSKPTLATREHLIPRSLGGGGGQNIVIACRACNSARGSDLRWIPWSEVPPPKLQPVAYARIDGDVVPVRDWRLKKGAVS